MKGCLKPAGAIMGNTDLLQATLPRQINQSEEGNFQESVQDQRGCEIERASPVLRDKVDEAERGDESQERDCDPDEDELDQSGSNHRLWRSTSSSTLQRRLRVSFIRTRKVRLRRVSVRPIPDKEGNAAGSCRTRFSRPPSRPNTIPDSSNGEKEEQDSEFFLFPLTWSANDGC